MCAIYWIAPVIRQDTGTVCSITAYGDFSGNVDVLVAELSEGGMFNSAKPAVVQTPDHGTLTLEFADCNTLTLTCAFPALDLTGEIAMVRVAPDNIPLCEALQP